MTFDFAGTILQQTPSFLFFLSSSGVKNICLIYKRITNGWFPSKNRWSVSLSLSLPLALALVQSVMGTSGLFGTILTTLRPLMTTPNATAGSGADGGAEFLCLL